MRKLEIRMVSTGGDTEGFGLILERKFDEEWRKIEQREILADASGNTEVLLLEEGERITIEARGTKKVMFFDKEQNANVFRDAPKQEHEVGVAATQVPADQMRATGPEKEPSRAQETSRSTTITPKTNEPLKPASSPTGPKPESKPATFGTSSRPDKDTK